MVVPGARKKVWRSCRKFARQAWGGGYVHAALDGPSPPPGRDARGVLDARTRLEPAPPIVAQAWAAVGDTVAASMTDQRRSAILRR